MEEEGPDWREQRAKRGGDSSVRRDLGADGLPSLDTEPGKPPSKEAALACLRSVFGHDSFLPGQWAVMRRILSGESSIAIFPTGGGKSLCYQLPAVLREETTLVVSPLKALMKDQVDALQAIGLAAAREDSSTHHQSRQVLQTFAEGGLDLLYVTPERFNNDRFVDALSQAEIDVLAIDEAHCISEWGHSFRPDYLKLARYAEEWEIPQVLGLTATATPRVAEEMCEAFDISEDNVVRLPSHRDNLNLEVKYVEPEERYDALVSTLGDAPQGPTIVYAKRRRTTEHIAEALAEGGFPARPFHAGLGDQEKHETQDWFMASDNGVVVATIAFGMGVDKADIRRVIHYNMPSSLESYAQEIGRAGRDGDPSRCTFLYCPDDVNLSANYEWGSTPTTKEFSELLEELFEPDVGVEATLDFLSYERGIGIDRDTVKTLVALLENRGLLLQHTPMNEKFRYRLLEPAEKVLADLEPRERQLFEWVQADADHKTKWSHLRVPSFLEDRSIDRPVLGGLMDELARRHHAEVTSRDWVYPYEVLAEPGNLEKLAGRYQNLFQGLEDRAVARIREIPESLSHTSCIWQAVSEHFGEQMDGPCGHCSICRNGGEPPTLPLPDRKPIPPEAETHVEAVLENAPELAADPMTLAEFLCGRYSIGIRTHGLHRLDGYRSLQYHFLGNVLEWLDETLLPKSVGENDH